MEKLITLSSRRSDIEDIREYKKALRARCKAIRSEFTESEKAQADERIFERIIASKAYQRNDTFFVYVSTEIEVDTKKFIMKALSDGKKVAAPRCIDGTRDMDFYFIKGMSDLEPGSFGVLEPCVEKCEKADGNEQALCIVPGLAFDMQGYRLGYGKGYYDRFLSAHPRLEKMGICYCSCTCNELVHGRFDISADMLVTEKYTRKINHNI